MVGVDKREIAVSLLRLQGGAGLKQLLAMSTRPVVCFDSGPICAKTDDGFLDLQIVGFKRGEAVDRVRLQEGDKEDKEREKRMKSFVFRRR